MFDTDTTQTLGFRPLVSYCSEASESEASLSDTGSLLKDDIDPPSSQSSVEAPAVEINSLHREIVEAMDISGIEDLRRFQFDSIFVALQDKSVAILAPTGSGKSLCYEIPAWIQYNRARSMTVVLEPMRAIIDDKYAKLSSRMHCLRLHSGLTLEEILQAKGLLDGGDWPVILFLTPEQALRPDFLQILETNRVTRFVLDEAHLNDKWRLFRDKFKELPILHQKFPGISWTILSGSMTETDAANTLRFIGIHNFQCITVPLLRRNISYRVLRSKKQFEEACLIIEYHQEKRGIIFCITKKACEKLHSDLKDRKDIDSVVYHGQMSSEAQEIALQKWINGEVALLIGTTALSHGIDHEVDFAILYDIPASISELIQQSGRIGRSGNPAVCYIFFQMNAILTHLRLLRRDTEAGDFDAEMLEDKNKREQDLRDVTAFAYRRSFCRVANICRVFPSDSIDPVKQCGSRCDLCLEVEPNEYVVAVNISVIAQRILEVLDSKRILGVLDSGARAMTFNQLLERLTSKNVAHSDSRRIDLKNPDLKVFTEDLLELLYAENVIDLKCKKEASNKRFEQITVRVVEGERAKELLDEQFHLPSMPVSQEELFALQNSCHKHNLNFEPDRPSK